MIRTLKLHQAAQHVGGSKWQRERKQKKAKAPYLEFMRRDCKSNTDFISSWAWCSTPPKMQQQDPTRAGNLGKESVYFTHKFKFLHSEFGEWLKFTTNLFLRYNFIVWMRHWDIYQPVHPESKTHSMITWHLKKITIIASIHQTDQTILGQEEQDRDPY